MYSKLGREGSSDREMVQLEAWRGSIQLALYMRDVFNIFQNWVLLATEIYIIFSAKELCSHVFNQISDHPLNFKGLPSLQEYMKRCLMSSGCAKALWNDNKSMGLTRAVKFVLKCEKKLTTGMKWGASVIYGVLALLLNFMPEVIHYLVDSSHILWILPVSYGDVRNDIESTDQSWTFENGLVRAEREGMLLEDVVPQMTVEKDVWTNGLTFSWPCVLCSGAFSCVTMEHS